MVSLVKYKVQDSVGPGGAVGRVAGQGGVLDGWGSDEKNLWSRLATAAVHSLQLK